jgi:hypothetical protein
MTHQPLLNQASYNNATALYPVEEIKRLYQDRLKYMQATQYIQYLEQENQELKVQIEVLKRQIK